MLRQASSAAFSAGRPLSFPRQIQIHRNPCASSAKAAGCISSLVAGAEGLLCEQVAFNDGGEADAPSLFVGCSLSITSPISMRMAAISHTCRAGRGNRELSDSRRKAAGARTLCGPVQSTKPLFTSAGAISEAQNENAFVAWHAGGFAARGLLLRFGRLAHDPSKKKKASLTQQHTRESRSSRTRRWGYANILSGALCRHASPDGWTSKNLPCAGNAKYGCRV